MDSKVITRTPSPGNEHEGGSIKLVPCVGGKYTNIFFKAEGVGTTWLNADMVALRDALIELYPLEPAVTKVTYDARMGTAVWRTEMTLQRAITKMADCRDAATAELLAAALNAA